MSKVIGGVLLVLSLVVMIGCSKPENGTSSTELEGEVETTEVTAPVTEESVEPLGGTELVTVTSPAPEYSDELLKKFEGVMLDESEVAKHIRLGEGEYEGYTVVDSQTAATLSVYFYQNLGIYENMGYREQADRVVTGFGEIKRSDLQGFTFDALFDWLEERGTYESSIYGDGSFEEYSREGLKEFLIQDSEEDFYGKTVAVAFRGNAAIEEAAGCEVYFNVVISRDYGDRDKDGNEKDLYFDLDVIQRGSGQDGGLCTIDDENKLVSMGYSEDTESGIAGIASVFLD